MSSEIQLKETLKRIDGKGYKAYKDINGEYVFPDFTLVTDHIQGDPFATPSRMRIRIGRAESGFDADTTSSKSRVTGLCDFVVRRFDESCRKIVKKNRGLGNSGLIAVDRPGQEILETTAMVINDSFLEVRFFIGLPAYGRKIAGREAEIMLFKELPRVVKNSLFMKSLNEKSLVRQIEINEDADYLRKKIREKGLVAFVEDGALLPRRSGIDPRPMNEDSAALFSSPESLRVDFKLPNRGRITGMGIGEGVTLIVGGGYHGKSTLLNALELGIYNHVPGDGREFVSALPGTVKIRAADGRNIAGTDISPFINNLPFDISTNNFSTKNASGSTSQAANITESIEAGAEVFLLDEDTSATNFMIRDFRMQQLVSKEMEPITPFVDKVRQLYNEKGISTIIVMGGSGDYFSVSDRVIRMTSYLPSDVTEKAHVIARKHPSGREKEGGRKFGSVYSRIPQKESFDPSRGKYREKISAPVLRSIVFGTTEIDFSDVEQIVNKSQTMGIAYALILSMKYMDGERTIKEIVEKVMEEVEMKGLDCLPPWCTGDIAMFRGIELASVMNRMRTLMVKQIKS